MQLVLVTRQGCHLCEDARRHLADLGYAPALVDVDADEELFRLYDFRVPVVLVDGAPVLEGHITRERLEEALGRSGRGSNPP